MKQKDIKELADRVPKNFSLVALHITDLNKDKNIYLRILEEEWYLFNDWYRLENGNLRKNEKKQFVRGFFGDNISVQAIVGKNGSGKSSVMELVYRIMNNLSVCMTLGDNTPGADPIMFIDGIYAELYFESYGKLGSISVNGFSVKYCWGDMIYNFSGDRLAVIKQLDSNKKVAADISRSFCFSLVSNYALMALNPKDYLNEHAFDIDKKNDSSWLDRLYHKNDGYYACIGFEPYKGDGIIDLERQNNLCIQRLWGVLIDSFENNHPLFDNYWCESVGLSFDEEYVDRKANPIGTDWKKGGMHPMKEFPRLLKKNNTFTSVILESYNIDITSYNLKDKYVLAACSYLVIKSLQIAELYPKFSRYKIVGKVKHYARDFNTFDKKHKEGVLVESGISSNIIFSSKLALHNLVVAILNDSSHIALKIKNTLHFLQAISMQYNRNGKGWCCSKINSYSDYRSLFLQKRYSHNGQKRQLKLDDIIEYAPPPFFKRNIMLKRVEATVDESKKNKEKIVPFEGLSAGERQILQSIISIIYHMRNIVSVDNIADLPKYYNVNLFLDEVEVCFHPAYQQRFIAFLLEMIKVQGLNKKCNINIILATHSPFILSDLPKSNILYLEDGKVPDNVNTFVNPFCANVNELLNQSFFMTTGLMGAFAKEQILNLIQNLKPDKNNKLQNKRELSKEDAKEFINMIGEPILKNSLMNIYNEVFCQSKDALIEWHQQEFERLKKEQDEKDRH